MLKSQTALIVTILITQSGYCQAALIPQPIAEGDWSKPVIDSRGYSIRGRLVVCVKNVNQGRREFAVYVELQDVCNFVNGSGMELICDLGKTDFRPECQGGLQSEFRDKSKNLVKPSGYPFGGAVPLSEWIRLPSDGMVRIRATPFGIYRDKAMAISPEINKLWVIRDDDHAEYFLSGIFTIDPSKEQRPTEAGHVWRGKIDLPAVRLSNQRN